MGIRSVGEADAKVKTVPEFTKLCQSIVSKGDKTQYWTNVQLIEDALGSINDPVTREQCVLQFLHNSDLSDSDNEVVIGRRLENLISITLPAMTNSTTASFCNKWIAFCRETETNNIVFSHNLKNRLFLQQLVIILKKKTTPIYLSASISKFILLLEPTTFNAFLQLNIAEILYKQFWQLWNQILHDDKMDIKNQPQFSTAIRGSHPVSLESKINYYTQPLSQFLFLYAHVLSANNDFDLCQENVSKHNIIPISEEFITCLLSLAASYNYEISWAATCVLIEYNLHMEEVADVVPLVYTTVLELISRQRLNEIKFRNIVLKYNIPLSLTPLSLLVKLLKVSSSLPVLLNDLDYIQTINDVIKNDYDIHGKNMSHVNAYKFSMCLTILSFMGVTNDKAKLNISKGNANDLICETLDIHCKMLWRWPHIEITTRHWKVLELSIRLTYASCLVLRSLSRSAALLRTYFSSYRYIEYLINILKFNTSLLKYQNSSEKKIFMHENSLQTLVLRIISNLVIEFSATRDHLNIEELLNLLNSFLEGDTYDETVIATLSIVRNALFGNNKIFKKKFLEIITLDKIFQFCDDKNEEIQILSFNTLRNLLTDSFNNGSYIYSEFDAFKSTGTYFDYNTDFVEFLRIHLRNSKSTKLTIAICYCLIHLAASTVDNKVSLLRNKLLMQELLELLTEPITNEASSEDVWEIKTCIAWVIIDLTYREETTDTYNGSRYSNHSDLELLNVSNRSNLLMKMGFHDALKKMAVGCPNLDFTERAGKAIFQMIVSTSSN